jgi:hypothetical protein
MTMMMIQNSKGNAKMRTSQQQNQNYQIEAKYLPKVFAAVCGGLRRSTLEAIDFIQYGILRRFCGGCGGVPCNPLILFAAVVSQLRRRKGLYNPPLGGVYINTPSVAFSVPMACSFSGGNHGF